MESTYEELANDLISLHESYGGLKNLRTLDSISEDADLWPCAFSLFTSDRNPEKQYFIGVAGSPGSGKTTVTENVVKIVNQKAGKGAFSVQTRPTKFIRFLT